MGDKNLFGDKHKYCTWCGSPISAESESDVCENCQKNELFREVREYVRQHDVNEFELADVFQIPLRQVKEWIRQGRLEYKEGTHQLENLHCKRCGKPISFGDLCPDCIRIVSGVHGGYEGKKDNGNAEQIRFYNNKKKKKK